MVTRRWLYRGKIYHARYGVAANRFAYPGLFVCFPWAQRSRMQSTLFGVNRPGIFSFYDRDHGDGHSVDTWLASLLKRQGIDFAPEHTWLQTLPRMLGFVFNPVSFWYCHDAQGNLRAIVCEVNNTFGERHAYVLTPPDQGPVIADTELRCDKEFHVSPFFDRDGEYRFRFRLSERQRTVKIDYYREGVLALRATVSGQAQEMSDRHLLLTLVELGWATVGVVLRIHWQALRLWIKGATFHKKPELKEISQ